MLIILYILTGLALLFVVFTLIMGAANMGSRKDGAKEKSNKWMWRRVLAQAVAIGLLALTVFVKTRGG